MPAAGLSARLAELERRWEPYGGRERMRLRPGLSDAVMDALVAPIGYELDEEQRAWWGWADGTDAETEWAIHRPGGGQVSPGISLVPLHIAVREHQHWTALNKGDHPLWPKQWLQLTDAEYPAVAAATGTDRTQVAIFDPVSGHEPRLQSLAHMVDVWLWFWDTFGLRPSDQPPFWSGKWPLIPIEVETLGVL